MDGNAALFLEAKNVVVVSYTHTIQTMDSPKLPVIVVVSYTHTVQIIDSPKLAIQSVIFNFLL